MTNTTTGSADEAKPTRRAKRQTKASQVETLLSRKAGATLKQMCEKTGWQEHTCRAFLSGLRKKGLDVIKESGKGGQSVYRLGVAKAD